MKYRQRINSAELLPGEKFDLPEDAHQIQYHIRADAPVQLYLITRDQAKIPLDFGNVLRDEYEIEGGVALEIAKPHPDVTVVSCITVNERRLTEKLDPTPIATTLEEAPKSDVEKLWDAIRAMQGDNTQMARHVPTREHFAPEDDEYGSGTEQRDDESDEEFEQRFAVPSDPDYVKPTRVQSTNTPVRSGDKGKEPSNPGDNPPTSGNSLTPEQIKAIAALVSVETNKKPA